MLAYMFKYLCIYLQWNASALIHPIRLSHMTGRRHVSKSPRTLNLNVLRRHRNYAVKTDDKTNDELLSWRNLSTVYSVKA